MRSRSSLLALAVAAALPSVAGAVDFSYSGFSTAAYAQTDTDEAGVGYVGQPEGIDSDGSFAIDSKLGMQVSAKFNDMFSATVQGVAYADLTADWEPRLDWAYLRAQVLPSLSARAGYMRAPTFMFSDSVFIGYANTWLRPPLEIYNLSPAYQLRGVDVTWRDSVGPATVSVQTFYGDSELDAGKPAQTIDVPEWKGLAVTAEFSAWSARVAYSELELGTTTDDLIPLLVGLNSLPASVCAPCASEAAALDLDGAVFKMLTGGVQYDDGSSIVIGEYAQRRSGSYVVPDMNSAYLTYGRRIGGFTPYGTFAMTRRQEVESTRISAAGLPQPFATIVGTLAAGVNSAISQGNQDQDTWSVGLRYEVPSFSVVDAALVKLQFDHIDTKGGRGMLVAVSPGFEDDVNMVSVSFDFIF